MYKILHLLFLPLFIASCDGSASTGDAAKFDSLAVDSNILVIGNMKFEISPSSKEEFEKYPSAECLDTNEARRISKDSLRVKRIGDSLVFFSEQKKVVLKNDIDTNDETSGVVYHYLESDTKHGYWVAEAWYYESADVILINHKNGDTVNVFPLYAFSPDGRYIFAGDNEMMGGYAQVLELKSGHYQQIAEIELTWLPDEVKWVSDKTILIRTYSYRGEDDVKFLKLTLK